jgi:NMD protein affecting ribosome stability and mRNA decay
MKPLHHGSGCFIPTTVAVCPECGGELYAKSNQWVEATGQPIACDIDIHCHDDEHLTHRYWQSHWQPVIDAIRKWCGAIA